MWNSHCEWSEKEKKIRKKNGTELKVLKIKMKQKRILPEVMENHFLKESIV